MKLTTQQIATIEQTLFLNGVVYEDIKLELIDHIASEIEAKMDAERDSFETIFKAVLIKWKKVLQSSSNNIWLGMLFNAPQIVVDKLVSYSKKQILNTLLLSVVFASSLSIIGYSIQIESFTTILRAILVGLFYAMAITTIISVFLIWQSSFKTTFGKLFLYQGCWIVLIFFCMTSLTGEPLKDFDSNHTFIENFISCLGYGFLFFNSFCQITMVFKHFKILSKLKSV